MKSARTFYEVKVLIFRRTQPHLSAPGSVPLGDELLFTMGLVTEIDELRVYRVIQSVQLRSAPNVSEGSRIPKSPTFHLGEMFAVDRVQPSPRNTHNGPFLRLCNNYGWLFELKHGNAMCVRMPLERGLWAYRVDNEGVGLALRSHPTNSPEFDYKYGYSHGLTAKETLLGQVLFPHGHVVWTDARVSFEGVTYLRVQGTTGWLFTRRGEKHTLIECVDPDEIVRLSAGVEDDETDLTLGQFEEHEGVDTRNDDSLHPNTGYLVNVPKEINLEMLPIRDLRVMAKKHKLRESYLNKKTRVVSFVKDLGAGETARIDVYYTTGTIGVTVRHHNQLSRTQSFYPRCGIREVEKIFNSPQDPNVRGGYKRRRENDGPYGSNHAIRHMGVFVENASDAVTEDEEMTLRGELRGLDAALEEMKLQRENLLQLLVKAERKNRNSALLRMHKENEMKELVKKELILTSKGGKWLCVNAMRNTHPTLVQSLEANFTNVEHIAITEDSYFVSRANGKCLYRNIDDNTAEALRQWQGTHTQTPYYVSSKDGRYFAKDQSGTTQWNSGYDAEGYEDQRFDELCRDPNRNVSRVAFGDPGSWFLVFAYGRWEAKGVSDLMVNFIHTNGSSPVEISIGEDDTYFVRCSDGEIDYSLPHACAKVCRGLVNKGHLLKNVVLSPTNTTFGWLIRYE